tara:strand:- start:3672 stop:4013 length:342 start_codon:yes stop_codon:yes gene_type:complete
MPKIPTSVLNESVTIQRLSGSSVDDRGLSTATFSDNSTSVQCRITHQSGQETLADGRIEINDIFLMTVSPDVDITTQDRVVWETRFYDVKVIKDIKDRFGNIFYKEVEMFAGF